MQNLLRISIVSFFFLFGCSELKKENKKQVITGYTQGTTYTIILSKPVKKISKKAIEELLNNLDNSLSNYNANSLIYKLNQDNGDSVFNDKNDLFKTCYTKSQEIFQLTNGAFDPSVHPLVESWGLFSKTNSILPDSSAIDSILNFVNFKPKIFHRYKSISKNNFFYKKIDKRFKIDFNAIAQGLTVDLIANYLDKLNIKNYFIEIGGEIVVKGKNPDGNKWKIGIDKPVENLNQRELNKIISISNKAIATSGNYRKFYIKNGKKYAHTINPKTGYPVTHNLLSTTVIADNCAMADAFATAFMVMGLSKSIIFLENHPELNIEAYFIFENEENKLEEYLTKGMNEFTNQTD